MEGRHISFLFVCDWLELKLFIFPLQAFWDGTGHLWQQGKLNGKFAGVFISTGGLGGGQESTAIATMSTFAHHGICFVPLGYAHAFAQLTNVSEVHGGMYLL